MATETTKITYVEGAAASTPAASRVVVYAKADGLMYSKDDAGAETLMSSGGAGSVATDAIWDAAGDLVQGTGANTAAKLSAGTAGHVLTSAGTAAANVWAYPAFTTQTNQLGANVTMTNANTYYDGPTLTLGVGTFLLLASVLADGTTNCIQITAKLWNGTTVAASAENGIGGNAAIYRYTQMPMMAVVTVASGTETWKVSCNGNGGAGGIILAAAPTNGAGNNASTLVAVRIA